MFSHPNASPFDNQVMLDYEQYMSEYERSDDIDYSVAYALIGRGILDNACREAIVFLWEDGTVDSCSMIERLLSEVKNLEIQKWLEVARVRSEWYLNMGYGNDPHIEWEFFDGAMLMTGLGSFDGMMRILVGYQIADIPEFTHKNDIGNINALFELANYHTMIESMEIRNDHILFSMGISMEHAPVDPIECMIEYFNTPRKCLYHKYYRNNNTHPEWNDWIWELAQVMEKPANLL